MEPSTEPSLTNPHFPQWCGAQLSGVRPTFELIVGAHKVDVGPKVEKKAVGTLPLALCQETPRPRAHGGPQQPIDKNLIIGAGEVGERREMGTGSLLGGIVVRNLKEKL